MQDLVAKMEGVMNKNIHQCEQSFTNFFRYGNHKSESESKIVHSFKADFEKMSMIDSFEDYINNEIPIFDPKWLTHNYMSDIEQRMFDKICDNLDKVEVSVKSQKSTYHLPDLKDHVEELIKEETPKPRKETKGAFPRQSMRLLANTQIGF